MIRILVACCLLAVGALPSLAQPTGADQSAFRPGDAVRITVWEPAEMSGTFDIAEDGTVVHPIFRTVRLAGMTHEQAQAAFRTVLQRWETDPQFVVEPLYRISVSGEVREPNLYTITSQTTVLQAIAQAGGATPGARLTRVRLLRGGREILVDLTDTTGRQPETRLISGDQLVVDARRNVWSQTVQPALGTLGALSSVAYLVGRIMNRW